MRTLVITPTYNEIESLPVTVADILQHAPHTHILIVDDNSPDGTGTLADTLAEDERIHVLHRTSKTGLGGAYIAGFLWGLEHGYDVLCEMDADGSHRGRDLPLLLAAIDRGAGAAIGSRWVFGGAVVNWPYRRHILSRAANIYANTVMGLHIKDATAGFRAYRAEYLAQVDLKGIASHGYCFQIDMTKRLLQAGAPFAEVPTTFVERAAGTSKMSRAIIGEAMYRVTRWGVELRFEQGKQLLSKSLGSRRTLTTRRSS